MVMWWDGGSVVVWWNGCGWCNCGVLGRNGSVGC